MKPPQLTMGEYAAIRVMIEREYDKVQESDKGNRWFMYGLSWIFDSILLCAFISLYLVACGSSITPMLLIIYVLSFISILEVKGLQWMK